MKIWILSFQDLEKQEIEAEEKLKNQKSERAKLEREEHKYWKEYSRHKRQLLIGEWNI